MRWGGVLSLEILRTFGRAFKQNADRSHFFMVAGGLILYGVFYFVICKLP